MKPIQYITLILILLTSMSVHGQFSTIDGQVYDRTEKQGLAFANIWLEGTNKGASTDVNGKFEIDSISPGTYNIRSSYIGYGDTTLSNVKINNDTILIIYLGLSEPCKYNDHRNNKTCPVCGKENRVIPIVYGLIIGKLNKRKFYFAGCIITSCDPNWYCKRDKYKF